MGQPARVQNGGGGRGRGRIGVIACGLLAGVALFSSCSKNRPDPDTFYRLTAEGSAPEIKNAGSPEVGLGPVEIPDYIDRYELVFQSSPNRFEIPVNHRWAGELRENISSVLSINLARRLGSRGVASYPYASGVTPEIRVAVQIHRFHAHTGEDAVLEATWFITGASGTEITRTATFREDLVIDGYEGVAAAESILLATLAGAIAQDLK